MKKIDKVALICIKENKILVTLSKGKEIYYLPGGKREQGENDIETLCREVKEELSVDIVTETIQQYGKFEAQAHGKEEGILVTMSCYKAEYKGELRTNSEIEKYDWLKYEDIDKVSLVDKLIFEDLVQKGYLIKEKI